MAAAFILTLLSSCLAFVSPNVHHHSKRAHRSIQMNTRLLSRKISFQLHPSISIIPAKEWNACLHNDSSPFLEHAWLQSLEESGCASPDTGWAPQHLSIRINGEIRGFVPLYIKGHSMGEFIFDNAWAEAAYQSGITYYPKLLVAIPFTPAAGQRILLHPDVWDEYEQQIPQIRKTVATFLIKLAESNKLSSVHFNFLSESEAIDLSGDLSGDRSTSLDNVLGSGIDKNSDNRNVDNKEAKGSEVLSPRISRNVKRIFKRIATAGGSNDKNRYLRRTSLQYHWINENAKHQGKQYSSFEEYLGCFRSKRRISIKRERRLVLEEENVRIDSVIGTDILKIDGLVERMFEIYVSTVDKMIWGRQYLTPEFFQVLVKSDFIHNLCFLCARPRSSGESLRAKDVFAGTFNVVKNGVFYGRYWGCLPGREVKNLHFETCYWSAIEFCIKNGIRRMEPGAGGGDYKWTRGFDPALIHSTHYIFDPGLRRAVSTFLEHETKSNVELTEYLKARSAVASKERNVSGL